MFFGAVTTESNFTHSIIFPHSLRHNMEAYIKCVNSVYKMTLVQASGWGAMPHKEYPVLT